MILAFSEKVKLSMVPLLPTLLKIISVESLPGSARIEATRGSNCLLEVCSPKDKKCLVQKDDTRALIEGVAVIVQNAGDFELQVTILECLFRLTTTGERRLLSRRWFESSPVILAAFNDIREGLFEVDCRKFLNLLNASCHNRQVYSMPCKKAFLGSYQLHRPHDEGLDHFWVDFNVASSNLSLYVDGMSQGHAGGSGSQSGGDDGLWESIIIKKDIVKDWTISAKNEDYCLTISLSIPSHSLLPTAPASTSNMVFITFGMESNPSQPLHLIFGSTSQTQLQRPSSDVGSSQISAGTQKLYGKQSIAILPIHLNGIVKPKIMQEDEDVSPIEILLNSQAIGEHVSSQERAATPPNKFIVPTPSTSTPKLLCTLASATGLRSSSESKHVPSLHSSSGSKRVPLKFVSSGDRRPSAKPKVSQSVSSIALGKNCRVLQGCTPARKPSQSAVRNIQAALLSSSLNESRSKTASNLARSNSTSRIPSTGTADVPKNAAFGLSTGRSVLDNEGSSMDKGSSNVSQATKTVLTRAKKGKAETAPQPHTSPLPSPPRSPHFPPQPKHHKSSARTLSHKPRTTIASVNQTKTQTELLSTSPVNVSSSPKTADFRFQPSAKNPKQKGRARAPSHKPMARIASANQPKTQSGLLPTLPVNIPSSPMIADICPQSSQSPPNVEMLTLPPKSSPTIGIKKKLSSSSSSSVSMGSVKSRTVLSDITNACLNRGGQQRLFNLGALPKVRKSRKKKKNPSSTCSSFNTSAVSEYNLHAIPDSMPLDATQRSSRSTRSVNVSASKRKSKRACTYRDYSVDDDSNQSWSISPPKQKRRKTTYIGQANKVESRIMLASARTKRGPNAKSKLRVASFDITDSDYENVDSVQPTKPRSKSRRRGCEKTKNNGSTFDDLEDKDLKINHGRRMWGKEALKAKDMDVLSPGNNPAYMESRRRIIDDIYKPQISPEPLPLRPTHKLTRAKMSRQSKPRIDPNDNHDELPSAKRSRKSTNGALQNAPSKNKPPSGKGLVESDIDELKDNIQEEQSWSQFHSYNQEVLDAISHGTTSVKTNNFLATRKQPRRDGSYSNSYYEGYVSYGYSSDKDTGNKTCGGAGSSKPLQAVVQNEEVEMSPLPPPTPPPLTSTSPSPASLPIPINDMTKVSKNIVQGFEDICHRLVTQSGRRGTVYAQNPTTVRTSVDAKPNRSQIELKTSMRPKKDGDGESTVTLTQLSRNIVNRHKNVAMTTSLSPMEERLQQAPDNKCTDMYNLNSSGESGPAEVFIKSGNRCTDMYNLNSSGESDIASTSSGVDYPISRTVQIVPKEASTITSSLVTKAASPHLTSSAHLSSPIAAEAYTSEESQHEDHTRHDINTEMNTLIATLKDNLTMARKMREQKRTSTSSRKVPEELKELWLSHKEERCSVLREYEQQITTKMNELEKDAKKNWSSEEGLNSLMQQHLNTLRNSRKLQQSQLQHLHTLQSSLCEQLAVLEASHLEQQTNHHGSLKKEMYNIHKKLLEESQKKELLRIKKSLEAMLMYV